MHLRRYLTPVAAILLAAMAAGLAAWWAAVAIEDRSAAAVRSRLVEQGITWASVRTDGLQVHLEGTAPNEAARFRLVNLVETVVQAARVRDDLGVAAMAGVEAPRFSVEMLRNDDGISLIGLVPGAEAEAVLADRVKTLSDGAQVSDMLETADYPVPEGWTPALDFGLAALKLLPRAKISVAADRVAITAISGSENEKKVLESDLARAAPDGLKVEIEISAPRPVLTPFALRFVKDADGARFEVCSADSDAARAQILLAASKAGAAGKIACTVGLGVPTQSWAEAVDAGIGAVAAMGAGTVTFSDADVTLLAGPEVAQAAFDRVAGDLQAQLPPVFSLQATMPDKVKASPAGPVEFTATLDGEGKVQLRGRLGDDAMRTTVDSFAKAKFGADRVYTATRSDPNLPEGWPVHVLAGLQALAELHDGALTVRPDLLTVTGTTGSTTAKARIAQMLAKGLGQGRAFRVDVSYDKQFDPQAALPSPEECVADMAKIMTVRQISFDPGSAEIDGESRKTIDALAAILSGCPALDMEIAGYTDSQGSEGGNQALSQARAEAVLTALQGRRLPVDGYVARGFGEADPRADNATEAGREANRRIEFHLLKPKKPRVAKGVAVLPVPEAPVVNLDAGAPDPDLSADTDNVMTPGPDDAAAMDDSGSGDDPGYEADVSAGDTGAPAGGVTADAPTPDTLGFAPTDDTSRRPKTRP